MYTTKIQKLLNGCHKVYLLEPIKKRLDRMRFPKQALLSKLTDNLRSSVDPEATLKNLRCWEDLTEDSKTCNLSMRGAEFAR